MSEPYFFGLYPSREAAEYEEVCKREHKPCIILYPQNEKSKAALEALVAETKTRQMPDREFYTRYGALPDERIIVVTLYLPLGEEFEVERVSEELIRRFAFAGGKRFDVEFMKDGVEAMVEREEDARTLASHWAAELRQAPSPAPAPTPPTPPSLSPTAKEKRKAFLTWVKSNVSTLTDAGMMALARDGYGFYAYQSTVDEFNTKANRPPESRLAFNELAKLLAVKPQVYHGKKRIYIAIAELAR